MIVRICRQFNLVVFFIIWRLILFTPLIVGMYLIIPNVTSDFTYIYNPLVSLPSFNSIFLFPWANFDGVHYLNIAQYGYINQARFFPLLPLLINILSTPFLSIINSPLTHFFVGFIFVNLVFALSLWIFKKLIELDFSKEIAKKSIYYLLIFPTAFFFVCIYSEGLFFLLTILSFYFARKRKWFMSILCASALMATRFVGIAIFPALLYEFFISENGFKKYKKLLLFLIMPVGLVLYSLFNFYKWQNFFYFIKSQGELGNNRTVGEIVLFPQTVFRYIKIFISVPVVSYDWMIALLEATSFLFTSFLLYFAWKKKIRMSYLIFAAINFVITISTGTFSALPRYILTLFPIFIALALIKFKFFKFIYITVSSILLFILLMLFSRGYFVA